MGIPGYGHSWPCKTCGKLVLGAGSWAIAPEALCRCATPIAVDPEITTLRARVAELEGALEKINEIRNSIVGFQTFNWSEHAYPLVAALDEVGVKGLSYPEARTKFGSLLERTLNAEARVKELEALSPSSGEPTVAVPRELLDRVFATITPRPDFEFVLVRQAEIDELRALLPAHKGGGG